MRGFERHVAALVPLIWGIPLTLACGGSAGTDPPPPPPAPTRGAIRVVTIHGGTGSDGNGLLVTLDGNDTLAIPLGNQIVVDSLLPGPHTVRIDDIAGNCHLQGSPTRSVGVVAGDTAVVSYAVGCFLPLSNLILVNNDVNLYTLQPSDGTVIPLLVDSTAKNFPAASPDGFRLAYRSFKNNKAQLVVAAGDGTGQVVLVPACAQAPAWSPDGLRIAYACSDSIASDIFIVPVAGGTPINITNTPTEFEERPSWSPDGSKLVFEANNVGGGLFIVNANGTGRHQLTTTSTDEEAAWSPDGSEVAFAAWTSGSSRGIFVVDTAGGTPVPVTSGRGLDLFPTWSPDGTRLAFARFVVAGTSDIFIINRDGSNEHYLTQGARFSNPSWSR